jgi:hypothetical protein
MGRGLAPLRRAAQGSRGAGDWLAGMVFGPTGAQRYRSSAPPA